MYPKQQTGPKIVTHFSKKSRSHADNVQHGIDVIKKIVGAPPRSMLNLIGWLERTGPVAEYTIGRSSNGRSGLLSRGSSTYNHCHVIIEITSTDGKGADERNRKIETALIKHFKQDPRCTNRIEGGGQTSQSTTSRNVYVAILADPDRVDELEDLLKPQLRH